METLLNQPAEPTAESGVVERLVNITLEESDYKAIQSTKQEFETIANYMLREYAQGGVMVPASKIAYLSDLTAIPIHSSTDLADIVENGVRRNSPDGTMRVTVDVDPAFAVPLEELAYAQGRTVNEIVTESNNIVLTNGWIYALTLEGGTIPLMSEQRRSLEKIIGVAPLTSVAITDWVERANEALATSGSRRQETPAVTVPDPKDRSGKVKVRDYVRKKLDEFSGQQEAAT